MQGVFVSLRCDSNNNAFIVRARVARVQAGRHFSIAPINPWFLWIRLARSSRAARALQNE
jgi:hypothetical protein